VQGIFAVLVHGLGDVALPGVASIGTRPTVQGGQPLLEVHLFDFDADIYGRRLHVDFVAKLRDEAHFDSLDDMKAQMRADSDTARAILDDPGGRMNSALRAAPSDEAVGPVSTGRFRNIATGDAS
jgi:riboflavin kinase/FMN adenylyltransferase